MDKRIPTHVAIIPDGNRRWARQQGLTVFRGHKSGVEAFRDIAWRAADRGVKNLSFWGISADNIRKRKKAEVAGLMRIFKREFRELAEDKEVHRRETKIRVIGRWKQMFPEDVKLEIDRTIRRTEAYNKFNLTLMLAYNGTDEMLVAIKELTKESKNRKSLKFDGAAIKRHLWTSELPPVDLVVRTGGEPHLSNGFMMWDTADAELYFTGLLWPEFRPDDLDRALSDFSRRRRRRGG